MTRFRDTAARATIATGCALMLGLAGCAKNQDQAPPSGQMMPSGQAAAPAAAKGVCIQTYMIDHTDIPDDSTILFHLRGGKIWKNSLPFPCPDLKFQGGFQYTTDIDEICSNLQTIRVIEQGGGGPRFGAVCQLGEFTPYVPPPKANAGG